MARFRSSRSASTPIKEPRNNPGTTLADRTRPTAVPEFPPPTLSAIEVTAIRPIQSPNEDTTCDVHSRKYDGDPNSLVRVPGWDTPEPLVAALA
jgi:hypothetical protein